VIEYIFHQKTTFFKKIPDESSLISFAIFIILQANVFKAPLTSTNVSWQARASNLFGADLNGKPVDFEISSQHFSANPIRVFKPVPTAVPPMASK